MAWNSLKQPETARSSQKELEKYFIWSSKWILKSAESISYKSVIEEEEFWNNLCSSCFWNQKNIYLSTLQFPFKVDFYFSVFLSSPFSLFHFIIPLFLNFLTANFDLIQ